MLAPFSHFELRLRKEHIRLRFSHLIGCRHSPLVQSLALKGKHYFNFNNMTSRTRSSPSKEADIALTVADWEAQGKEALELKCTSLHLDSTGTSDVLAQRLFDHFHPIPESGDETPGSLTRRSKDSKDSDGTSTDEDVDSDKKARHKFGVERTSPSPSGHGGDDTGVKGGEHERPDDISTQEYDQATAQAAFEAATANALLLQDVVERVGELGATRDELLT